MNNLPTGIVTFLFTDIEGSTRLLEARPDAYRAALARHDALIRQAVAAHGGMIFSTRGDGFCAAFTSPIQATHAALLAQRTLSQEPWDHASPIKSRMGLHTGEVELQDGEYFGTPLHRCARLMDSAHGGQAVLSATTAALVGEAPAPGAGLKDLGEYRLRDITRPERIFQLIADDLPSDFPPPRTLSTTSSNLPPQATTFIGREQPLQAVQALLLRPAVRLLTLTGPGGTGKTRLALQVAGDAIDAFKDGAYFVPLASVTDPDLVSPAIAQSLDVREVAGRSLVTTIAEALRQKQVLLLLDNFEQVVAAAPQVAELLVATPGLKILVTSRAVLRLYGEREYPVPPLALPDHRTAPSAAHLAGFESVHLFVDRAQAARPDFALTDENAADIAEICHRLDGLPLAIELAAARIRALTPHAMLQRMERRLPLLTGGARDLPARQQTLRGAIAWSYDLLDPDEQSLFRRLAVFRGCTLEAAETVCAGDPPRHGSTSVALLPLDLLVLDGIESLVEKSLLRQEQTADRQPWYRMLETVREFALERLEECGESDTVHRRHALAAMRLAESSERALHGPGQAIWLARLEQEHDNLRAALRWCEEQGYAEPALRLAIALWSFWSAHGHVTEGRERFDALLTRFPPRATSPRAEMGARALFAAATLATIQGDLVRARDLHEDGLSLRRTIGDPMKVFTALEGLGQVANLQGDHEAARVYLEEALAIARAQGDKSAEGSVTWNLGVVAHERGDRETARIHYETSIAMDRNQGGEVGAHLTHLTLALLAEEQRNFDEAEAMASQALSNYRQWGIPRLEALALAALGGIALGRRSYTAAREHLCASIAICQTLGDIASIAQVLDRFIDLAAAYGCHEDAVRLAGSATALRERVGAPRSPDGQQKLDHALRPACDTLGAEAADTVWQAGRALSLEEAIELALGITEPVRLSDETSLASETMAGAEAVAVLTRREQEVAVLIAGGQTNRQIAEALVITEGTSANHVNHILDKLGFSSRAQVAAWAAHQGLIAAEAPEA
jgi:predicted ATPase/class 3 adenylate cyclase/DNA-binding CsgD family transcriptional regulator